MGDCILVSSTSASRAAAKATETATETGGKDAAEYEEAPESLNIRWRRRRWAHSVHIALIIAGRASAAPI